MQRKRPKTPAQDLGSQAVVASAALAGEDAPLFDNQAPSLGLGLMTVADVARELGKSESTIRSWVGRREIPFLTLGNQNVFRREGLREWLQKLEFKPRGRH